MIYTVTFNPAIDYIVRMDKPLDPGMTNRSASEDCFFGGKGINVSTVLKNLGIENTALGFAAGFTGEAIVDSVNKKGIIADFIMLEEGISRINVKIKGEEETEINAQGPKISDEAYDELLHKLDKLEEGDVLILAGSIPNSLPSNVYEIILERLYGKGIMFVVDATKDLLLKVLKYNPFLIKPNNHELGEMFGVVLKTDDEIEEYARKLQDMERAYLDGKRRSNAHYRRRSEIPCRSSKGKSQEFCRSRRLNGSRLRCRLHEVTRLSDGSQHGNRCRQCDCFLRRSRNRRSYTQYFRNAVSKSPAVS